MQHILWLKRRYFQELNGAGQMLDEALWKNWGLPFAEILDLNKQLCLFPSIYRIDKTAYLSFPRLLSNTNFIASVLLFLCAAVLILSLCILQQARARRVCFRSRTHSMRTKFDAYTASNFRTSNRELVSSTRVWTSEPLLRKEKKKMAVSTACWRSLKSNSYCLTWCLKHAVCMSALIVIPPQFLHNPIK